MRKYKNAAVRRQSTGRTKLVDRSNYLLESSMHTSTGRSPYVDRSNMLLESIPRTSTGRTIIADRSNPPDVRKVSRSNIERDFSYASIAFMANGSFCKACSLSKLGSRPSYAKDTKENIPFLHRIQGNICRLIHSYCGLLRYFMILVDASTYWSHVA